jgi:predicted RNA-binding Zn-ribbon protein involved in translation (DUF1610 family)
MITSTKFDIGDKIYYLYEEWKTSYTRCTLCDKDGQVKINEKYYRCPNCEGEAKLRKSAGYEWRIKSTDVSEIDIHVTKSGSVVKYNSIPEKLCSYDKNELSEKLKLKRKGVWF